MSIILLLKFIKSLLLRALRHALFNRIMALISIVTVLKRILGYCHCLLLTQSTNLFLHSKGASCILKTYPASKNIQFSGMLFLLKSVSFLLLLVSNWYFD